MLAALVPNKSYSKIGKLELPQVRPLKPSLIGVDDQGTRNSERAPPSDGNHPILP